MTEPSTETAPSPEEDVMPRPRTLRRAAPVEHPVTQVSHGEPEPDVPPRPVTVSDDEEEVSAQPAAPIHGGWTAGQQVMDATATWAQALKLEDQIQIIKFLDDQPYANYRRHWVERIGPKGKSNRPYTCLETVGRDCPLCAIADRAQAVSAFNVVLVGDDGQVILKTWDVGVRLFGVLKAYSADPKVGPLTKGYFAVNQTGTRGSGGSTQTNVTPIRPGRLAEDYEIPEPTEAILAKVKKYDPSIIQIPKFSELDEIAQEIADLD